MRTTQLLMFLGLALFSFFAIAEDSSEKDCFEEKDPIECLQNKNKLSPPDDIPSPLDIRGKPLTVPVGADLNLDIK